MQAFVTASQAYCSWCGPACRPVKKQPDAQAGDLTRGVTPSINGIAAKKQRSLQQGQQGHVPDLARATGGTRGQGHSKRGRGRGDCTAEPPAKRVSCFRPSSYLGEKVGLRCYRWGALYMTIRTKLSQGVVCSTKWCMSGHHYPVFPPQCQMLHTLAPVLACCLQPGHRRGNNLCPVHTDGCGRAAVPGQQAPHQ
jgi:hypothetical protein